MSSIIYFAEESKNKMRILFCFFSSPLSVYLLSVTPVGGIGWLCAFSGKHSAYYRLVGQDSLLLLGLIY